MVNSQSCIPYNSPLTTSGTFRGVLPNGYQYYVNQTNDIATKELQSAGFHMALSNVTSIGCRLAFTKAMAAHVWPACDSTTSPVSPVLPCESLCTNMTSACVGHEWASIQRAFQSLGATSLLTCQLPIVWSTSPSCHEASSFASTVLPSASCQLASTHTAVTTNGVFKGAVDVSTQQWLYLPAGATLSWLETMKAKPLENLLAGIQDNSCRQSFLALMANKIYMPCDATTWTVASIALPRLPCRSLCQSVHSTCGTTAISDYAMIQTFLTLSGSASTLNCTAQGGILPGQADYPLSSTTFGPVSTTCFAPIAPITSTPIQWPHCQTIQNDTLFATASTTFKGVMTTKPIYLPSYQTLQDLESKAKNIGVILSSLTTSACRAAVAKLFASKIFMPCADTSATALALSNALGLPATMNLPPFPQFPSRDSCQLILSTCMTASTKDAITLQALLAGFGSPLNCTGVGGVAVGMPDYPVAQQVWMQTPYGPLSTPITNVLATNTSLATTYSAAPITQLPDTSIAYCSEYTGVACRGVTSGRVFFAAGSCQATMEDMLIDLPSLFKGTSANCTTASARLMCHQAYPVCDETTISTAISTQSGISVSLLNPVPFPRFPQRKLCTDFHTACTGYQSTFFACGSHNCTLPTGTGASPYNGNQFGIFVDVSRDGNIAAMLLGDKFPSPTCVSTKNIAAPNEDFPTTGTYLGPILVPANTGAWNATTQTYPAITTVQPQCIPFSSQQILEEYEPLWITGQRTSRYPSEQDEARSFCKNVIPEGRSVYVPQGMNMTYLNQRVREVHFLFGVLPRKNGCSVAFARYVCNQVFMPCESELVRIVVPARYSTFQPMTRQVGATVLTNYTIQVPSAFPRFPCRSICEDFATKCYNFYMCRDLTAPGKSPNDLQTCMEGRSSMVPNCDKRENAPSGPTKANKPRSILSSVPVPNQKKISNCTGDKPIQGGQLDFPLPGEYTDYNQGTWIKTLLSPATPPIPAFGNLPMLEIYMMLHTECNPATDGPIPDWTEIMFTCPYPTVDPRDTWYHLPAEPNFPGTRTLGKGVFYPDGQEMAVSCALPCRSVAYSEEQYHQSQNLMYATNLMSFPLLLFMIATWVLFDEKRGQRFILYFVICCFINSLAMFVSVCQGMFQVMCRNISTPETTTDRVSWCTINGFLIYYSALSGTVWWFVQAFDLWLKVVLDYRPSVEVQKRKHTIYLVCGWVAPFIVMLCMSAEQWGGQENGLPWCGPLGFTIQWFFFVPVGIMSILGICCMVGIITSVCRSANAAGSASKNGAWKVHLRPILFILCWTGIFSFVFVYRFYAHFRLSLWQTALSEWIKCHVSEAPKELYKNKNIGFTCTDRPVNGPELPFALAIQFGLGSQGIWIFLLYGTMYDNYKLWSNFLGFRKKMGTSQYEGASRTGASYDSKASKASKASKNSSVSTHSRGSRNSIHEIPLENIR